MNKWTKMSIDYANQRNYLDELFKVYPTIPEGLRDIDKVAWANVERHFKQKNNQGLIKGLLDLDLFPLKDSYVAYLRRDSGAIARNPETVNRLCGRMYEMGLDVMYARCSEAKETNRQIGPMFRDWIRRGSIGVPVLDQGKFLRASGNCILDASDNVMMEFARKHVGYEGDKGLDFVGRFGGKFVIGEAKFLTDFGGHQNAQFEDAKKVLADKAKAVKVAILDGVLYIEGGRGGGNKMFRYLIQNREEHNVLSSLVLNEFLFSI